MARCKSCPAGLRHQKLVSRMASVAQGYGPTYAELLREGLCPLHPHYILLRKFVKSWPLLLVVQQAVNRSPTIVTLETIDVALSWRKVIASIVMVLNTLVTMAYPPGSCVLANGGKETRVIVACTKIKKRQLLQRTTLECGVTARTPRIARIYDLSSRRVERRTGGTTRREDSRNVGTPH